MTFEEHVILEACKISNTYAVAIIFDENEDGEPRAHVQECKDMDFCQMVKEFYCPYKPRFFVCATREEITGEI